MAAIAGRIADSGANIDRIERMARYPVTAIDLHVSGANPDRLRALLALEAAAQGVDVAVQPASLLRRAMRLIVMDVDSTLIQGEVIELLAAHSGHGDRVAEFTEREWPAERLADIDEVAAIAGDDPSAAAPPATDPAAARTSASLLIDARQRERFEGEPDAVDPRAGHIPGALSVPCRESLDADGCLLPIEQLRARFDFGDADVVSYCGSGVTACHNLLAMEQAGLHPGRLFPGSWSQWSRDPSRSVQTGGEPTGPTG